MHLGIPLISINYYISIMKKHFLFICTLLFSIQGFSQTDFYQWELQNFSDISRLPEYRTGDMHQLSSYDRTGGNDDGFSGKYSYIRKEGNNLIVADIKGAGIINRIWTPTPSKDTIQFYFDGEKQPRINMPFIDLFSGKVQPFVAPLCGNEIGGYYCYLPIPYAKSLKIVYKGNELKFHQIQYRELSNKEKVKSFSWDYFKNNQSISEINKIWNEASPLSKYGDKIKTQKVNITLKGGEEKELFELSNGGRIVGIELDGGHNLQSKSEKLVLKAQWDNEERNAIDVPFYSFFGYVLGKPSMNSILLGSTPSLCYSYLPMPFDDRAKLSVEYKNDDKEITISGKIYYTEEKRNSAHEGKLYTQARREYSPKAGEPYTIANIRGKGHYVGTILIAQGLNEGMTEYWESDDCSLIDGEMRMHGTGSEDYFNGGWYAVTDRWDRGISLPIHGSLLYDIKTARTGGYRFFLSDKINFNSSYVLTIEHGPAGNNLDVDYTSVGLFYANKPQFENKHLYQVTNEIPRRDILLPQEMTMRLYWFTQVSFNESSMTISSKREDYWTTNIDFEAVPMVQFDLTGMDNGKYKVYVVHTGTSESKPFSVWQRTNQVSDWISSKDNVQSTSYAGEIKLSDQIKTLTLRKKKMDDTSLKIDYFIFEKIKQ